MEYNLDAFFNSLISYMAVAFPYMQDEEKDRAKHPNRNPLHLKDAVFDTLVPYHAPNNITFDIGSETLESNHPYYHILQDAQVIRKRNKGTDKSRGSQAKVENVGSRDYGRIEWNGKTFTKEYSRNVRGSRSLLGKASKWENGKFINREANYYANTHYKYLDNMLDNGIVDMLAQEFGLKKMRKVDTGLGEEMALQEFMDEGNDEATNMINILSSFEEN